MKKSLLQLTTALFFLFTTAGLQAMDMNHGQNHNGMDMQGDMIMLDNDMQAGVMASAHLRDISKKMKELGMDQTHHFMIIFKDHNTKETLDTGIVAVKVIDPEGNEHKAVKLMGMEGSFGVDVALNKRGKYTFEVGTKLADDTKRQFHFTYMSHS